MSATPESPDRTITEAELAAYYERHDSSSLAAEASKGMAARIFADVAHSREPEYEPGEMYRDASGALWLYEPEASDAKPGSWAECPWLKPGATGSFSRSTPKLPLRKLVPEGQHEQAAVLVAEWRRLGEQDGAAPRWRDGYRAALRKCADELGYALKAGDRSEH